jgi:hypothetical protein
LWVEALTHCLEILGRNLSFQTQQFSAASVPPAFDRPILIVIIALPEMALSVALTPGHGTNRQHTMTVALFEVGDQGSCCLGDIGARTLFVNIRIFNTVDGSRQRNQRT